jgi:phosphomannomutase/phosphoglucomutase
MVPGTEPVRPNSEPFVTEPVVKRTGFREYDARWRYPEDLNPLGVVRLGAGIATHLARRGMTPPRIVVGQDYRSYSEDVKHALVVGLLSAGAEVHDVGVGVTALGYFAQHDLGVPAVAMVTASHNENGWTGVKVGAAPSTTYGPEEIAELRDIVLAGEFLHGRGSYRRYPDVRARYLDDLVAGGPIRRRLRVVVATGNGTAGLFAPHVVERLGCEVIPLHTALDWTFPNGNPNPEDVRFLTALRESVRAHRADLGLGFDGDGDRLGVVDDRGEELYSDKVGLLLARHLIRAHRDAQFIVDVKSTALFASDPILRDHGATVEYWKTGHSYIKSRVRERGALAGFEKSGHFFFAPPIGRGYDDANASAVHLLRMLDATGRSLSALRDELPPTWQSPTMAPVCADERKYAAVAEVTAMYAQMHASGERIDGHAITNLITVNGVRVVFDDGSWVLVRASSNKPSLVVVLESPVSESRLRTLFADTRARLAQVAGVGEFDQTM